MAIKRKSAPKKTRKRATGSCKGKYRKKAIRETRKRLAGKPRKKHVRRQKALKPINFKRELAAGIRVEMEHAKRIHSKKKARKVAERIARDHLEETPYYYRRLKKCFPEERHNPSRPGLSHMLSPYRIPGRNPRVKHKKGDTYMSRGYAHKVLMTDWRRKIDPRSIRTKTIKTKKGGKRLLRFGCPKGEWMSRKKHCRVGTKAISIMTPKEERIVSMVGGRASRRGAGNPESGVVGRARLEKVRVPFRKSRYVWVVPDEVEGVPTTARRIYHGGGIGAVVVGPNLTLDLKSGAIRKDIRFPAGNPKKQFWMDRAVQTSGLPRKCLSSRKDPESQRLRELSGRMESNLKRLRVHDEYLEKTPPQYRLKRKNPVLTIPQARKQLPPGWVLQKTQDGEYRVGRRGSPEAQRYYTDDIRDAVETAHLESLRQPERERSGPAKRSTGGT